MTTMGTTLYEQLRIAERKAGDLRAQIASCRHSFRYEAEKPVSVQTPAHDFWAGPGYATTSAVGLQQERTCTICGLRQKSTRLSFEGARAWEAVG